MFELLFGIFVAIIFGRLFIFGLRMAWGIGQLLLTIVLLPLILVFTFFKISIYLAWPLLLVIAIVSLFRCNKNSVK